MKNFLIACGFVLSFSCVLDAQILATTSEGDTVLLKSDGTWDYLRDAEVAEEVLPVNPEKFSTPKANKESYKGISKGYQVWYNDKTWERTNPKNLNPLAEIAFKSTEMDAYGMLIYEAMEASSLTLADVAIIQARKVATDVQIISKEIRNVNGYDVVALEMTGKLQSIDIYYMNYYYSGPQGSIQFLSFTTTKSSEALKPKMESLLNGLTILKD